MRADGAVAANGGCNSEQGPSASAAGKQVLAPKLAKLSTGGGGGAERESGLAGASQQLHQCPHPQPWSQTRAALWFELRGCCPSEDLFIHPSKLTWHR